MTTQQTSGLTRRNTLDSVPAGAPVVLRKEGGQPFTTSLAIAEGSGVQHTAVMRLIKQHHDDFQALNPVGFEIRPGRPAPQGGFNGQVKYAVLTEQQAYLLLTYMRNNDVVRAFKIRLIRAFFAMRQEIAAANAAPAPTFNPIATTRSIATATAVGSRTLMRHVHDHFAAFEKLGPLIQIRGTHEGRPTGPCSIALNRPQAILLASFLRSNERVVNLRSELLAANDDAAPLARIGREVDTVALEAKLAQAVEWVDGYQRKIAELTRERPSAAAPQGDAQTAAAKPRTPQAAGQTRPHAVEQVPPSIIKARPQPRNSRQVPFLHDGVWCWYVGGVAKEIGMTGRELRAFLQITLGWLDPFASDPYVASRQSVIDGFMVVVHSTYEKGHWGKIGHSATPCLTARGRDYLLQHARVDESRPVDLLTALGR